MKLLGIKAFFKKYYNLYVHSPRNLGTYILVRKSGEVTPPAVLADLIAANDIYFILP